MARTVCRENQLMAWSSPDLRARTCVAANWYAMRDRYEDRLWVRKDTNLIGFQFALIPELNSLDFAPVSMPAVC